MRTGKQSILGNLSVTGNVTAEDITNLALNIILNAFRLAIQGSLSLLNMVDSFVDEYEDETGINTGSSLNQLYDSADDFYGPTTSAPTLIDTNTLVLIEADGADGATNFVDASRNFRTITAVDDAQIDTAQSKFGGSSALFNGNGALSIPDSTDWAFGTGDFTIEAWIRGDVKLSQLIYGQFVDFDNRIGFGMNTGGSVATDADAYLSFRVNDGSSTATIQAFTPQGGTGILVSNTWHHVAVARTSGVLKIFIDGISQTLNMVNGTGAESIPNIASVAQFGANGNTASDFTGWLDEMRVSNVGRWTSDFTPPTTAYSAQVDLTGLDRYFMEFNGVDGATTSTDESVFANSLTFAGNSQIDTAQSKFGGSSLLLDGTGDYVAGPNSSVNQLGALDFTFEAYIRLTGANSDNILWGINQDADNQLFINVERSGGAGNRIRFFAKDSATVRADYRASWTPSNDVWYHVVISRQNTSVYIFIDGVSQSVTETVAIGTASLIDYNAAPRIGEFDGGAFAGWIDDFHFVKGKALYTANFTPRSSAISQVQNITLISESQTADEEANTARLVLFEEDIDVLTLNTDIKGWASRDNGVTFTQITLVEESMYDAPARVLSGSVDISGQPSGTDMVYKVTSHNNKNFKLHGTGMLWS